MAWYDTGTVSVTNGSTTVTGSGTNFVAGAQVGEGFYGPDNRLYEIQAIVSATSLTLADVYLGTTQSGQAYKIVPTQSLVAALASQVSTLISDFQGVVDEAGSGKFDDGTAASAGITFTLDQDTGIFRPAANQIGFTTAGVQRALVSNTGVDVTGTITADGLTVDGPFTSLGIDDNAAATAMTLDASGNVGIGTAAPINRLSLYKGISYNADSALYSDMFINSTAVNNNKVYNWRTGMTGDANGHSYTFSTLAATQSVYQERMRIDASGNVGIGTAAPASYNAAGQNLVVSDSAGASGITIASSATDSGHVLFADSTTGTGAYDGLIRYDHTTQSMRFGVNAGAERMRIDSSGNLLVGTTALSNLSTQHVLSGSSSTGGNGVVITHNTAGTANCPSLVVANNDASTDSSNRFVQFYGAYAGGNASSTAMGGIVGNGSGSVAFATISDERNKENILPVPPLIEKFNKLKVVSFDFKENKDHVSYGFTAQNVLEVFPEFVVPNMSSEGEDQRYGLAGGMSSGYVAVLTAALQEALNKIDALEARVAALEL